MKNSFLILLLACCSLVFAGSKNTACAEPLVIKAGKPTVIIASVFAEDDKEADDFYAKRELAELQNNFPDYDILLVDENRHIVFENNSKDIVSLSNPTQTTELVAFWDGKKSSSVKVNKIKVKLTEYISELTSQDKKSSYLAENEQMLAEYNKNKELFNPDKNSKAFGQYYIIDRYFNKMVYGPIEFFKPQDYKGVKSVTVYSKLNGEPEELAFKMNFNAKNQVTDILYAKRATSKGSVFMVFSYDDNGLLKKMISNENFDNEIDSSIAEFAYDNGKLIEYSNISMWVFSMQHGMMINNSYIEFKDVETTARIKTSREEINGNCIETYDDGHITSAHCPSNFEGTTPYTYENRLYGDDVFTRKATSKIEETGKGIYTLYTFASAINEYKQIGEVTIGESGRTERVKLQSRQQNYTLRFEYK